MMKDILISIILPIYNSEKTLNRAIDSILKQDYQNYELILVNDGSTDKSGRICSEYKNKYSIVKYFEIKNEGVSNARNVGLKHSKGEYIMFIDSDDEYCEDTLSQVYQYIQDNKTDWIIFGYDRIHVNNKIKVMNTNITYLEYGKQKNIFIEKMQQNYLFNQIWNKVYKSKIIKEKQILFEREVSSGEDYRFNLKYIDAIDNAIYLNKVLYKYYSTENGLSLKVNPNKMYIKLDNLCKHKEFYIKYQYDINYIDKNYINTCFSGLTAMVGCQLHQNRNEYLKQYINNEKIKRELEEIKKRQKNVKMRMMINILLIKNVTFLKIFSYVLIVFRKLYRKVKLG